MIHSCFCFVFFFCDSCSWVPCLSWTVKLPAVLQKNPSGPTNSLVFQAFLCIWTLSNNDCMILRSIFSHWGQLMDSRNYYRRFKHSLMLQKEKRSIKRIYKTWKPKRWKLLNRMKMCTFFLFCLDIFFFFSFSTALQELQKILYLHVSQKPKKKLNVPWSSNSPLLLMHGFSFWSISECLNLL